MPAVTFDAQAMTEGAPLGHRYALELASGGTLTLIGRFDAFALSIEDRAFVYDVIDRLATYQIDWQAVAYRALSATEPRTIPEIRRHALYGSTVSLKHAQMRLRRACLALARQGRARAVGRDAWQRAARPAPPRDDADLEVVWNGAVRRAG